MRGTERGREGVIASGRGWDLCVGVGSAMVRGDVPALHHANQDTLSHPVSPPITLQHSFCPLIPLLHHYPLCGPCLAPCNLLAPAVGSAQLRLATVHPQLEGPMMLAPAGWRCTSEGPGCHPP